MHCLKDEEKLFGFAMEFLQISLHFWQPSAITMEAMDIDACQIHINSLGNNRLTRYCILFFKIATQDAKSLFCECHKSGKNFFEDISSWTF